MPSSGGCIIEKSRMAGVDSILYVEWSAMKTLRILISLVAVVVLCQASGVRAQENHEAKRENFVLGLGAGWGNAGADLTIVEKVDRQNGVVGDLRIGWAVRKDMVFGVDFDVWSQVFQDDRWVFNLSAVALTYFPANKGAFVNGGVGFGTSRIEVNSSGSNIKQDRAGIGYFFGGGYEWWIAEEVAVGPQIKWAFLNIDGDVTKSADYFSIMVQLTWYKPGS